METVELKRCPFCNGNVEFEASAAVYNRRYHGKCLSCGMEFAYQEEHEPLEIDYKGLQMKHVYYNRLALMNKPFFEVWNRRADDEPNESM